jgi:four helix bundle protein
MSKIENFEDVAAWPRARVLGKEVCARAKVGKFGRDFGLRDQIQRASVSAMANIAVGFERGGDKEFVLSNSQGSCDEVKSHLYVWTRSISLKQYSITSAGEPTKRGGCYLVLCRTSANPIFLGVDIEVANN